MEIPKEEFGLIQELKADQNAFGIFTNRHIERIGFHIEKMER